MRGGEVNTLSRYLVREFTRMLAFCWLGLAAAYLLVDFLGKLDNFLSSGAHGSSIALYLAASFPQALVLTGPLSALLAAVLAVEILARNRELIAMRACGIAPRTILAPLLAAAVILALGLVFFEETVAPVANREAARIWDSEASGTSRASFAAGRNWHRGQSSILSFHWASDSGKVIHGLMIYRLAPHFSLSERLDAREARYLGGGRWELKEGVIQRPAAGGAPEVQRFSRLVIHLAEEPKDFAAGQRRPQDMAALELYKFAARLRREGYDPSRFLVDMLAKPAFSFGAAVLVGLGLVFSLRGHRGGMAAAIGFGLLAAFLFWTSQALLVSLGRAGVLPWWLAPWGADIIAGLAAWRLWVSAAAV
jgi:lipopolysaccharide export system permease protein